MLIRKTVTLVVFLLVTIVNESLYCQSLREAVLNREVRTPYEIDPTIQSPYSLNKSREFILLGSGAAMGVTALVLIGNINPFTPGEIAALDPSGINSFDRIAIRPFRETQAGDAMLYGSFFLPLSFLADDHTRRDLRILGVMWAEVLLLQSGITGITKGIAKRTRPYAYDPNTPLERKTSRNVRVSFFSGHTATTAATSFFVAKVFSDYLESTPAKILLWTGAAVYPAMTAYLRRDSGHHFRTDVIAGYTVGALIGYFIPELHKDASGNLSIHQTHLFDSMGIGITYTLR